MKNLLVSLIIFVLVFLLIFFVNKYNLIDINNLINLIEKIQHYKLLTFLIILLLYFFSAFIYIPIAQFSILSGVIFGFYLGAIISYIGSIINIMIAFLFSRFILKDFFNKIKSKIKLFNNIMEEINKNGAYYIFWARLFFITPYNSLNIVSSLSSIGVKDFFLTTVAGATIQAIFYAYIGSIFKLINDQRFVKLLMYRILFIIIIIFFLYSLINKIIKNRLLKTKKSSNFSS